MKAYTVEIHDHCDCTVTEGVMATSPARALELIAGTDELTYRDNFDGGEHFYIGFQPRHRHAWVFDENFS